MYAACCIIGRYPYVRAFEKPLLCVPDLPDDLASHKTPNSFFRLTIAIHACTSVCVCVCECARARASVVLII